MTWETVSRTITARLLKQLPKLQRNTELARLKLWRKYASVSRA